MKKLNKRYEIRGDTIERYRFCYVPKCPFVLYVGRTKLIQRAAFEKYINSALEL